MNKWKNERLHQRPCLLRKAKTAIHEFSTAGEDSSQTWQSNDIALSYVANEDRCFVYQWRL